MRTRLAPRHRNWRAALSRRTLAALFIGAASLACIAPAHAEPVTGETPEDPRIISPDRTTLTASGPCPTPGEGAHVIVILDEGEAEPRNRETPPITVDGYQPPQWTSGVVHADAYEVVIDIPNGKNTRNGASWEPGTDHSLTIVGVDAFGQVIADCATTWYIRIEGRADTDSAQSAPPVEEVEPAEPAEPEAEEPMSGQVGPIPAPPPASTGEPAADGDATATPLPAPIRPDAPTASSPRAPLIEQVMGTRAPATPQATPPLSEPADEPTGAQSADTGEEEDQSAAMSAHASPLPLQSSESGSKRLLSVHSLEEASVGAQGTVSAVNSVLIGTAGLLVVVGLGVIAHVLSFLPGSRP